MIDVDASLAHRTCAAVTRKSAANFYYGIRLLPTDKRRALCAVYAFARRIDDVGDGPLSLEEKLRGMDRLRDQVALVAPEAGDPILSALGHGRARFPLSLTSFEDLIDGVEMDVLGSSYERFEELLVYCRRVAGSIGRLSVAVFGSSDPDRAARLGDDLGVAMQLTNILRDIREDVAIGRVYLPTEDMARFGFRSPETLPSASPAAAALIRFQARRARSWFARGLNLLPLIDARSASCVMAMTGIYRRILDRIDRRPMAVLERRIGLPAWEKGWVAARSLAGGASRNLGWVAAGVHTRAGAAA